MQKDVRKTSEHNTQAVTTSANYSFAEQQRLQQFFQVLINVDRRLKKNVKKSN
jgi:hypothetical protein